MNPQTKYTPIIVYAVLGGRDREGGEMNSGIALMNQPKYSTAFPAGDGDGG